MAIRFHDPRARVGAPVEPYHLAADWSGRTPAIGLLANGFPADKMAIQENGVPEPGDIASVRAARIGSVGSQRIEVKTS
mgnify:CR=1 FL=1